MSDITKRINALFAKAESTDSAEEAQALFAKAVASAPWKRTSISGSTWHGPARARGVATT